MKTRFLFSTLLKGWAGSQARKLVTTELLGTVVIPNARYENPDGTPLRLDTDYAGQTRDASNPAPGPFANLGSGAISIRVR